MCGRVKSILLPVAAIFFLALLGRGLAAENDEQEFFRFDSLAGESRSIAQADLRPGYIYNHFDDRLNRRVWSYYAGGGEFWHALGPGSVENGAQFDIVAAIAAMAAQPDPQLVEDHERRSSIKFRLQENNQWSELSLDPVRQIYDLYTKGRWEKHGRRLIPVRHSAGYRWSYRGGRFVPAFAPTLTH